MVYYRRGPCLYPLLDNSQLLNIKTAKLLKVIPNLPGSGKSLNSSVTFFVRENTREACPNFGHPPLQTSDIYLTS